MILFLVFAWVVSFIFGMLFLFAPEKLRDTSAKFNKAMNKLTVSIDDKAYKLRTGIGVSFILAAFLVFFVAFFLYKKYG